MDNATPWEPRFWTKVNKTENCWLWTGSSCHGRDPGLNFGHAGKRKVSARRLSWEMHHGPIPPTFVVEAMCGAPLCIRPDHLRLASPAEQTRRMIGVPRRPRRVRPIADRFWPKVQKGDGCWLWQGSKTPMGYGQLGDARYGNRPIGAHRVSWELHFGAIPAGLIVCHHCDNPPCVRPDHLFLGTVKDNSEDMVAKHRGYRGEAHHKARLTEEDVRTIRARVAAGESYAQVGHDYRLGSRYIGLIITRRNWTHV